MNTSELDYANASAFVRRIHAIDAQIGRDNRIAVGFALGEQLKNMELIRHPSGRTHYPLPVLIRHCEDCKA